MSALQTMMPETTRSEETSSDASNAKGRLDMAIAVTIDLRQQVKQAHWNVTGTNFIGLHKLFDKLAAELDETIDIAAERQRALGSFVSGSLRDVAKTSVLVEYAADLTRSENVLSHLVKNYRMISADLRDDIEFFTDSGDPGTADMLTDAIRMVDQHLFLLSSHLV